MSSALITREPKVNLNITKSQLLRLKVKFGHLSVTLSNAGHARKCVGDCCTVCRLARPIDYGLMDCFRPVAVDSNLSFLAEILGINPFDRLSM